MKRLSLNTIRNSSVCAAVFLAGVLHAQTAVRYDSQPGANKVKVEGTSTIHDWTVESQAIGGFMELDPAFDADLKTLTTTPKVEVNIPVRQLKASDNKPSMDKVMYEHMGLKDNPIIKFRL